MSKLAIAADALGKFLLYALPVVAGLHAFALISYAALVRNWNTLKPLLPRNGLIFGLLVMGAGVMIPLQHQAERWHYAEAYAVAGRIESQLGNGQYLLALKARAVMTINSPARQALDKRIAQLTPRVLTESINIANRGDYVQASQLAELTPTNGPEAKKRARLLVLWQPYAARQKQREAQRLQAEDRAFARTLEAPLASYDRLVKETQPKALQLDPTASTRIDGKAVHPLASLLLTAGVRAKEIEGTFAALGAPGPRAASVKSELTAAASAFKHACVESLSFANTADSAPAERAKHAFNEASAHRAKVEQWRLALVPPSIGTETSKSASNGLTPALAKSPTPDPNEPTPDPADGESGTLTPTIRETTDGHTVRATSSPTPTSEAHASEAPRPAAGFFPTFPPYKSPIRRAGPQH